MDTHTHTVLYTDTGLVYLNFSIEYRWQWQCIPPRSPQPARAYICTLVSTYPLLKQRAKPTDNSHRPLSMSDFTNAPRVPFDDADADVVHEANVHFDRV